MSEEEKLKAALARLEHSIRKVIETRGYSRETRALKLLSELIQEQLTNGHTRHSTRSIR